MAVRFDAVGDQLNRTANLPPNGSFTYMMWAVIDNELAAGTYQPYLWALDATSQQGYACGVINGIFDIECYNAGAVASSSSVASRPTAGQAACIYVRCSGTGANLINSGYRLASSNAFVSSGTATLGTLSPMTQLYMGGLFGVYWMDGRRWNIKVWDRALSDGEILAESYYFRPQFPASLNFWLPLHNANDVADRSGNARNPTTAGTLTAGDSAGQLWKPSRKILLPRAGVSPTNYTLACDGGSYSLTGVAALLRRGFSLVADTGSYALTGQDAALRRGYQLAADPGSYALAGQDAALRRGYSLALDVGSYALSGQDAALRGGYSLALDTGAYSLAGNDATLTYSAGGTAYSLVCDAGAYALTGYDAGLTYTPGPANYSITADTGSYALAGNAAGLTFGRRLVLDVGSYGLSGQAAALIYGRRLVCEPGVYALAGSDADLIVTTTGPTAYSLTCETGAYLLGGSDAALIYTDGSAPVRSNAGFVLVDHEPKSWWKRKPKAVPVAVAEKRIKRVAKAIDEIAAEKIEQDEPINQREVRAEIAQLLAEMPGFDFRPLFKAIVEFRQAEAARLEAIAQIERIRAIEQDDEDVLILLLSF